MNLQDVRSGLEVRTSQELKSTKGMIIKDSLRLNRVPNTSAIVLGWVGGHGGDVWIVQHHSGHKAAYSYDEFEKS